LLEQRYVRLITHQCDLQVFFLDTAWKFFRVFTNLVRKILISGCLWDFLGGILPFAVGGPSRAHLPRFCSAQPRSMDCDSPYYHIADFNTLGESLCKFVTPLPFHSSLSAAVITLCVGLGCLFAPAQTTDNASSWAGVTGASLPGPYDGAPEQINLSNGNLNITLPILSLPGRGGQNLTLSAQEDSLTYRVYSFTTSNGTSFSWINNQPWQQWGISYLVDTADLAGILPVIGGQGSQPVWCDHFAIVKEDGTWLTFDNVENCVQGSVVYPLPFSQVNVVTQSAMEFAKLDTTNPSDIVFTSRDGNQTHFSVGSAYKLSALAFSVMRKFGR
jgi:hypothetical protein